MCCILIPVTESPASRGQQEDQINKRKKKKHSYSAIKGLKGFSLDFWNLMLVWTPYANLRLLVSKTLFLSVVQIVPANVAARKSSMTQRDKTHVYTGCCCCCFHISGESTQN